MYSSLTSQTSNQLYPDKCVEIYFRFCLWFRVTREGETKDVFDEIEGDVPAVGKCLRSYHGVVNNYMRIVSTNLPVNLTKPEKYV